MAFFALLISVLIVYAWQHKLYEKRTFEDIDYKVTLNTEEIFEGEDIFLYEEITNDKVVPVPYVKSDTSLPEGIRFRITNFNKKTSKPEDSFPGHVSSVFVLKSKEKVRRRWRVNCRTRGVYCLGNTTLVSNDLFGFNPVSKGYECTPNKKNTVVVLPRPMDLEGNFTSSYYDSGDVIKNHSLLTDPLRIAGAREYTVYDPMSKINWKQTAVHGKLMVNSEEFTQRHRFNIMLNMNSRDIEQDPFHPSSHESIELCITVCASILDRISQENVPVRIISNTPPETVNENYRADTEGKGEKILFTPAFEGKRDMISALRLLAQIKYEISCPIEQMLDYVLENHDSFAEAGNLIIVSSYISERMIIFHDEMARMGVHVIFYVTTTNRNADIIPPYIEVYYKTFFEN